MWQVIDGNGGKTEPVDYVNWTTPGQEIEGTYLGSEYRDDLEFPNTVHSVRQPNGRKASFGETADLKKKLAKVRKGERLKITFEGGGEILKNGNHTRKQFGVQVDR